MPRLPLPLSLRPRSTGLRSMMVLLALSLVAACSSIRPYTLDIQQGIVVDQKMIGRLSPGMTRNQVSLALGTPLLTDPLHADRWDYVYYTRHNGTVGEWRRFTCVFKDDRLAAVTGDVKVGAVTPAAAATGATAAVPAVPGSSGPLPPGTVAPAAAALPAETAEPASTGVPAPSPDKPGTP